jgi:hypothetical protein
VKVTLKGLTMVNFKSHKELSLSFGALTTIRGMNGEGKSSIGETVSWTLFGIDLMGSKLDPTPTDREVDKVYSSALLNIDGKDVLFARELVKGKANYYINDVPTKATAFDETVKSIASKDLFLSLFNPSYFPALKWTEQREMLLSYVSAPASSEVFKELPKAQADALAAALKKHNLADLEALHRKNKTDKEKQLIAAKARLETLEQQNTATPHDIGEWEKALSNVEADIKRLEDARAEQSKMAVDIITKERTIKELFSRLKEIEADAKKLTEQTECSTCKQAITEETKEPIKETMKANYKELRGKYKALTEELSAIVKPDPVDEQKLNELREDKAKIQQAILTEQNRQKAAELIEQARMSVVETQTSLNESIFILDAIKAYNGAQAVIQAQKVQALFTTLSVKLWDVPKTGEPKPTFELEMDGKPYAKLSLGEKLRAGIELVNVLSVQSGLQVTCFIDNRESLTSGVEFTHQLIGAYAVPNQTLEVTTS